MKLETKLIRALGKDKVHSSSPVKEMYAYDSSPFMSKPDFVVFPSCTAEVSRILNLAWESCTPILPRGAGTCLSGGAVPVKGGISLVMTQMNQILDIDPLSRTALVQPGVVNLNLQKALAPHGLIFPPDPASQKVATIGGNVAECAGGIQGARYGVTKNYVLGLELVLSDGTVTTTGLLSKDETLGPDSTGIFNGSEGSLAVITKILVSCLPQAQAMRTALASFKSLNHAGQAVSEIIKQGIIPTALELMDQTMLRAVDDFTRIGFPKDAQAVLLMEVDGYEVDLDHQLELMEEICRAHQAGDIKLAVTRADRENLWLARRSGNGALGRIRPAYIVHDVTVPRNQVATLLTQIQEIGRKHQVIIAQMAHAGDGNAHPHLLYYPDDHNIEHRLHDATRDIFKAALELGGTISGEHGIGLEKKAFMGMQFTRDNLEFMERIQAGLDPRKILNPGKIFPTKKEVQESDLVAKCSQGESCPHPSDLGSDHILEFIPDNLTLKVCGNTPLWKVQKTAASINAFLPLCTHTQGDQTMAYLVETGAHGHEAFAMGSLREYIYGLEFTPASQKKISTGGHTAKNVAGYDFTRLLWKSQGTLARIEAITLKLLPCPEKQRMIVQDFPTLSACFAHAEKILGADICLCTLKISSRTDHWQMITGLMGSAALVEMHTDKLSALFPKGKPHWEIIDQNFPDKPPLNKDCSNESPMERLWKKQESEQTLYPFVLLRGAGLRRPMMDFLKKYKPFFGPRKNLGMDIDLGCPDLSICAKDKSVSLPGEIAAFPHFHVERPGQILKTSQVHDRILKCMIPGTEAKPPLKMIHIPQNTRGDKRAPCPKT